jgi:hypothetical protein
MGNGVAESYVVDDVDLRCCLIDADGASGDWSLRTHDPNRLSDRLRFLVTYNHYQYSQGDIAIQYQ